MTHRLRLALAFLLVLPLGLVWLYLYHHSQAVDTASHGRVLERIREVKQIDANWNVDMLRSLADLHRNYDPLTRSLERLAEIREELLVRARATRSVKVEKAHAHVEETLARKLELVERFKSQDAVLKNSLRYIPTAHSQLQPGLRLGRPGLEGDVGNLVAGVLKYQVLPDPATAEALRAAAPALRTAARSLAPATRDALANLLDHTEAVLHGRAVQATLLAQMAQLPVTQRLDALAATFTARFDEELRRQAEFQRYLVYYSGFALLLIAAAVGLMLRRGATEFRRMAQAVEQAKAALRQSESQLVHAEKMAMLGEVVSGIVHEINTPLGYLRSGLESSRQNLEALLRPYAAQTARLLQLLRDPQPDALALGEQIERVQALQDRLQRADTLDETATLLGDGIAGVQQINETVVNLLNFSRLGRSRVAHCRVETGLESTLKLASHFLAHQHVVCQWGETPEIECDLSQLNQVFLNIIKNAAQATPASGGEITIATSVAAGGRLRVDIADNGIGIAPQHLPRVFDPMFTMREDGAGTGLGLSISQRIVHNHGGTIEVVSAPGHGTTFSVLLPVAPSPLLYASPTA